MDEKPKRRWFRFRLSTWLVLVVTACWALAIRPVYVINQGEETIWVGPGFPGPVTVPAGMNRVYLGPDFEYTVDRRHFNPQYKWAILVVAAFFIWKVVERRRRHPAAPE